MKRILLVALALLTASAVAQTQQAAPASPPDETVSMNSRQTDEAPSYSDLYCAGFITKTAISRTNQIAGGEYSPEETQFARGSTVFVKGGGLQEGAQYSVLRELHDPNRWEPFVGARKAVEEAGQPYAELGRIRVVALRGSTAVAEVEFSCQNITLGDLVIPFKEHAPVSYRKASTFQRFPADSGHLTARIIMAKEFDAEVGRGQKVYINAGTNKGVQVGDYFRAVRGYDPAKINAIDALSNKSPIGEDTQKVQGTLTAATAKTLPVRSLGEMIVIDVTDSSATAMITSSLDDIEVGDWVQLEDRGPAQ